jgi:arabinofuranosyltransferase
MQEPTGERRRGEVAFAGACVWLLGWTLVNAWVCDDAYISMRTVDAFLRGDGLVWNPGERVQVYTHPLWLGLLIALRALGLSAYAALLTAGLASTGLLLLLLRRVAGSGSAAWPVVALLGVSPAFVHFATSGLEAPLTHLLLALFHVALLRGARLRALVLLASCVALNRIDAALLCAPALLWASYQALKTQGLKRALADVAVGALPLVGWLLFALVYYGTPLPNTAYAKLAHGLARTDVLQQGASYLLSTLSLDPVGSVAAALGIVLALRDARPQVRSVAQGALLYLAYVVSVGGDFMAGRFTTPVLVVGALSLLSSAGGAQLLRAHPARRVPAVALLLALGALPAHHVATPLRSALSQQVPAGPLPLHATHWVTVEQGFYWESTALVEVLRREEPPPYHEWATLGARLRDAGGVHVMRNIGFVGYAAAGGATVVDPYALSDAFLARLPAFRNVDWHVGHYRRSIPPGYLDSLRAGRCVMPDPALCELFDLVREVTTGPVLSATRAASALRLLRYRPPPRLADVMVHGELVTTPERPEAPVRFVDSGLDVRMVAPTRAPWAALLHPCLPYALEFYRGAERVGTQRVVAEPLDPERCLVRAAATGAEYDRVRVLTLTRPGPYRYLGPSTP